jgi:FemAB-related protein (PEP-CTERM system-associated)
LREISELKKEDEKAWDEYVLKHPDSTFYHQIGWKNVVEKSYGHKPYYLLAKEDGEIKGVLPLFFMESLLFGKKLVSVPFAPYGGEVGDCISVEDMLIERAIEISKEVEAKYMELRNNKLKDSKLDCNNNYMTLILKLDKDPELVWQVFNNKVRNSIRKSLKFELETNDGNVEEFYNLYSKNMRDLGTPTHSKEFFNNVMSEFKEKAEILSVRLNGKSVSAAILLYFKNTIISGWAASDSKYDKLNSNNLLYWNAIKSGCERGFEFFDFGRSIKSSGTYRFKKPWGANERQLNYVYYLNKASEKPDTSQSSSKRMIFAEAWKILPVSITRSIGPIFRKDLA